MNRLSVVILLILPLVTGCLPPPPIETYMEATISVAEERLSLSPLISEARMEDLPDWPSAPEQQKILLRNFDEIWSAVLAEFRRCQKYGLYTMVEDNNNPTIRISITLTSIEYTNDTLSLPVRLQAERLRDDQRFIYTLPAIATANGTTIASNSFYYYGILLSNYRRHFPSREIVSFFYRHKISP